MFFGGNIATASPASNIQQVQIANSPFTLTAAAAAVGASTVYTGTITGGGSNAFASHTVTITGFATAANNIVSATITASTTSTITVNNSAGALETHAGSAKIYDTLICTVGNGATVVCPATTFTATNFGQLCVISVGANPNAPTAADASGNTWTNTMDVQPSGQGRHTCFSAPNLTGGSTTVTITKGAAATYYGAVLSEWSGMATSSPLDVAVSAAVVASPAATTSVLTSNVLTATQTDLSIGVVSQRTNSTSTFTWVSGWTPLGHIPFTADGDNGDVGYIANGVRGQFTANVQSTQTSAQHATSAVLYKSAGAGSAPAGDSPTIYTNLEGVNGNTVSLATLAATTYGPATWTVGTGLTGLTYSTAVSKVPHAGVTVNGQTFTTSTTGLAIDMNQATHPSINITFGVPAASTASFAMDWRTPTTSDAQQIGMLACYAGSGDLIGFGQISNNFFAETFAGSDWAGGGWTLTPNTHFQITGQYKTGGANQSVSVYETSTYTNLATFTNASVGTTNLLTVCALGRPGAEGTTSVNTAGEDNFEVDLVNGIFPLLSIKHRNYYLDHGVILPGENRYTTTELAMLRSGEKQFPSTWRNLGTFTNTWIEPAFQQTMADMKWPARKLKGE